MDVVTNQINIHAQTGPQTYHHLRALLKALRPLCAVVKLGSRDRSDRIISRSWVRVVLVTTGGRTAYDTIIRYLKAVVLHAHRVVTIGSLGRIRHICVLVQRREQRS